MGNWDEFVRMGGWDVSAKPPMALAVEAAAAVPAAGQAVSDWTPGDVVMTHPVPLRDQRTWAPRLIAPAGCSPASRPVSAGRFATTFVDLVGSQRSVGSQPIERVLPLREPSGRKNRRSFESFLTARFHRIREPRRNVEGKLPRAGSAVAGDDAIVSPLH